MTASKAGASPACPAVTWMDSGRARLSLARWTFVLNPPRERPSAGSSGSERSGAPFPWLRPNAGEPGRWWSPPRLSSPRPRRHQPLPGEPRGSVPCAVHGPPDQAFVRGLKRPEILGQVAPGRAGAVLPRDGFQGPAVVGPPSSTDRIGRHKRLDPVPHRISDHQADRHIRSTEQPIKETRSSPAGEAA